MWAVDRLPDVSFFVARFIGATNTFGQSVYILKIWSGAPKFLATTRYMTMAEAAALGVVVAYENEHALKLALVTYLVQWMFNKRVLPPGYEQSTEVVCRFMGATLSHWVDAAAVPVHITDNGCPYAYRQCISALDLILNRIRIVFSLGRWTCEPDEKW